LKRLANLPLDEVDWISKKIVKDLKAVNIVTLLDLALMSPEALRQIGYREESLKIIQRAGEGFSYIKKAADVLGKGQHRKKVSTGSLALDTLLGGGISKGKITEVYGESGSGKTQLCFQLCVNYLTDSHNGNDIVYVDTVGTFRPERIVEMAGENIKKEDLLKHILSIRARTWTEQVEAPLKIDDLMSGKVGILIIDTLTDNFIYEFQTGKHIKDRQIALARHLHDLAVIAIEKGIAVVVTNTVRARMPADGNIYVTETGGNTVSQGVHTRLRLDRFDNGWSAQLNNDEKSIRFKIGKRGLMDWEG